ncbi:MAG: TraR/DksA C4-type zinc finger protein [Anaerolineae bacterium]|nr:TraR/DksA C4-type zinc finger protein [Anaerolineae bacterium]
MRRRSQLKTTAQEDTIAEARARLLAERAEVLNEVEMLRSRLETKGDYSLGVGDPMIYQWELNLALLERAQQHLAEIEAALEQLELGIYGRCERCGKPIEPERLAVLGHTTVCSQCAQRRR